ncbi:MAG: DUF3786 domain-containing protein [Lachnospiraceae bacterium]|nr:DUF3786 domain-containing protein [Lachnospiraceae bacterium]
MKERLIKMALSNYDITRDNAEQRFLNYDQKKMIEKFHLKHDEQYLYTEFVGRDYRINRSLGRIEWTEDGFTHVEHAGFNEVLAICDALCDSKEDCRLSGRFVKVNDLKGTVRSSGLGNDLYRKYAEYFDGRLPALRKACETLGGERQMIGDVSYLLHPFSFLPLMLQFWESDDEFPASLKLMWDENTLDFLRYETTYYVLGHVLERLKTLMEEDGKGTIQKSYNAAMRQPFDMYTK